MILVTVQTKVASSPRHLFLSCAMSCHPSGHPAALTCFCSGASHLRFPLKPWPLPSRSRRVPRGPVEGCYRFHPHSVAPFERGNHQWVLLGTHSCCVSCPSPPRCGRRCLPLRDACLAESLLALLCAAAPKSMSRLRLSSKAGGPGTSCRTETFATY